VSLCVACGQTSVGSDGLCPHHTVEDRDWAVANRIMCDFIHRGVVVSGPRQPFEALEEFVEAA
jgi:hypothetical protein